MNALFARAVFAFLALPGVVAFFIPWLLLPSGDSRTFHAAGAVPLIAGVVLLLWCVREFYRAGKGTLAPWAPPRMLVVTGLYRYSRNPMYIAVILMLCGWALAFRSWPQGVYALAVTLAFHLRVVLGEEPWLARAHGEAWLRYTAAVPRWLSVRRMRDRPFG